MSYFSRREILSKEWSFEKCRVYTEIKLLYCSIFFLKFSKDLFFPIKTLSAQSSLSYMVSE